MARARECGSKTLAPVTNMNIAQDMQGSNLFSYLRKPKLKAPTDTQSIRLLGIFTPVILGVPGAQT